MPDANSINQAQKGFRYWLAADDRLVAAHGFESPGFDTLGFKPVELSEPGIVALVEKQDARRGRGFFAARTGGGTPLLIQAPHQYYDLRTGTLARKLFLESNAMAAAWNTTHRYHSDDTDLVHIADSYLHALSRAFADVHPKGRILQLHGFSSAKRESLAGREAQAILSDGSSYPSKALARLTDCLSQRLDIRALLYPRDVRELGATTNTLAADLRRRGFEGFVHLELDAELRKRLVRDADARNILIQCVAETRP
ncbi:hypothetical protein GPM19_09700 [Halomonas sp. ZH2S]|uniref:Uncharacterized protein n=1 Tax=Vreelandella zhuhanensis TaxID=2684210 RepID=A0A7X3H151_9GAMM|nr:hypothetical protein [Halomonas zhuhanensis]MWJ28476.1 hypothetical protein [Halomonas zhuhanensis]